MRRKDESKKPIIADFINAFYYEHDKVPSVREIVEGTGIPLSTVHRYLVDMQEKGELRGNRDSSFDRSPLSCGYAGEGRTEL